MRRQALLVLFLPWISCARHPSVYPDVNAGAVVTNRALIVIFPVAPRPAAAWTAPGQHTASGFPYYDWRFGVSGVNGFTAIASVDKESPDAANARGSLEAVVKHLALRQCGPGGHILQCPRTIAGSVQAKDNSVVVTVHDTAIVELLRRERPQYMWRSVFLPDAFIGPDSTRIRYAP
jgi:hypothetical protein